MSNTAAIQEALVHGARHCPYHNTNFGFLGWTGAEGQSLPRCDSCKQPWRVARALDALDRLVRTQIDAPNAALADVTDLLDEARTERDAARAEVEELRRAAEVLDFIAEDRRMVRRADR